MAAIARDYESYAPITIDSDKISSTFSDFVFKVSEVHLPDELLDADGTFAPLASGADIRFFDSNAALITPLPFDIVIFNLDNTPSLSKVEIHVKVPSVSSSVDTVIHVAWGMPRELPLSADDANGSDATYSARHEAVYTAESTGTNFPDRTGNGNDGTKQSSGDPTHSDTSGLYNDGQEFSGDGTSFIDLTDIDMGNNFYIQFALKTTVTSPSGDQRIVSKKDAEADTNGWEITRVSGSDTQFKVFGSNGTAGVHTLFSGTIGDGNWHVYGFNFNGTVVEFYANGDWSGNSSIASVVDNNELICLGNNPAHNEVDLEGFMDDVWIFDVCGENERFALQRNQLNPATFAAKGSRVALTDPTVDVVVDNVQRDNFTMSGTTQDHVIATGVDLSQSILFPSFRVSGADVPGADDVKCDIYMLNSTTIRATRYGGSGTVTIHYELVEFSAGVTVQRFIAQAIGTGVVNFLNNPNPINRFRSFIMMTDRTNQPAFDSDGRLSVEIEHTNQYKVSRATSGGVAAQFSTQIIQYDGCFVQWLNDTNAVAATFFTDTIPDAVVVGKTVLIGTLRDSGANTNAGDQIINIEIEDSTTVIFTKFSAVAHGINYRVFVVEFTDDTIVQQYLNTLTAVTDEISQIVSPPVNRPFSVAIHQGLEASLVASADTVEDGDDFAFTVDLTSNTNITMIRGQSSGVDAGLSIAVIQFLASADGVNNLLGNLKGNLLGGLK